MHRKILNYIENISPEEILVNKLLISLFLYVNNISVKKNLLLKNYIITSENSEYKYFLELIDIYHKFYNSTFSFEQLIELFEFVISPSDKVINGAVYTPLYIREYIISKTIHYTIKNNNEFTLADISCGCGGFLFTATKLIRQKLEISYSKIFKNYLYGLDIKEYSITRTKLLLSLYAISNGEDKVEFDFNLYTGNALSFDWFNIAQIKSENGFDIIAGNPPYVCSRNIDKDTSLYLDNWSVNQSGHPDLYITFFQIGLKYLKCNGILSYITVNTFFKSINGRELRKLFDENKFEIKIIDFRGEQVFKSRSTYTCICTIFNRKSNYINYCEINSNSLSKVSEKSFTQFKYEKLNHINGWILNTTSVSEIISKIENTGEKLGNKFSIKTGIATLKNDIYKFTPIEEDKYNYYFLKNGNRFSIEKAICKDIINTNKITKNNDETLIIEKIIFPYYYSNNSIELIDEEIFKSNYPLAYLYLKNFQTILGTRDKGKSDYKVWYSYGRNQNLGCYKYKLFFPHICNEPKFIYNDDPNLFFYNGMAIIGSNEKEILIIKIILESDIFWFYIKNTSRPYYSNYFSLSRNYIKDFGLCNLDENEKELLLTSSDSKFINKFLQKKYNVSI